MISKPRKDYLTAQYVWVLQSDGDWYRKAKQAIEHRNQSQFHRTTKTFLSHIRQLIGEITITDEEYNFISDQLYDRLMPETLREVLKQEIGDHIQTAQEAFSRVASTLAATTKEKEHTMNTNPTTPIEIKTVIFGRDAAELSEQDLIEAIKRVEGSIGKLKEVKTSSKKIAANIEQLEEQLAAIVAVLDTR